MFLGVSKLGKLHGALLLGALSTSVAAAAQSGCSSGAQPGSSGGSITTGGGAPVGAADGSGTVGLSLTLPGGAQISSVTYTLQDSGGNLVTLPVPNPGTVSVANSGSIDFQLGGVPPATGDTLTLSATTSTGGQCQGVGTGITVTARQTTNVQVQMTCTAPPADAGNVFVTGVPSFCGTWTSLASGSTGSEAFVGESVVLTATATGPDPNNLGYTWSIASADGGTVAVLAETQDESAGPSDSVSILCTAPGTATVTVVVDDGPVPDAGACPSSLTTVSTNIVCDAVPAGQVQAAWVEIGSGGTAMARAVTAAPTCPSIAINGASQPMNLRIAAGTEPLRTTSSTPLGAAYSKPSVFPVNTCEITLPPTTTSAVVAGRTLPLPKANPTKVVVIGDTGCRMKRGQAAVPTPASPAQGADQFQGCNDPTQYPFAQVSALAASLHPDVVLHVGDYQYRENECPPSQANCAGNPWGYGWDTWEADFFQPAATLLAAAPWIVTRGNHESCARAGQGWYRFLDTNPYSEAHSCNAAANDAVLQDGGVLSGGAYNYVYAVPLGTTSQVIVFDSNQVGSSAVTAGGTSNFITYQTELQQANALATSRSIFNIWSNHHPLLGFAPNAGAPPSPGNQDLLSVMAATFPTTFFPPNINLVLHGHTHLFEAIDFTSTNYPATVLSGNAGDSLDIALPDPFPASADPVGATLDPSGNVAVSTIADAAAFGLLFMQFTNNTWVMTEYRLDGSVRTVCTAQLTGQMTCTVNGFIP